MYTREQIEQGFKNWNDYILNGGAVFTYDAKTADSANQASTLIEFITQIDRPVFPENILSKGEG